MDLNHTPKHKTAENRHSYQFVCDDRPERIPPSFPETLDVRQEELPELRKLLNHETKPAAGRKGGFIGVRHLQYFFYFSVINLAYGMRTILSVGIYAMINPNPPDDDIATYPEWASKKNVMLSSFFWGYICLQVGAGQLAKNYGPKRFLCLTFFVGSVFCLLIPVFGAWFGYGGVIACRVITGMTQGFIYPCVHNLISAWTPVKDRAKVATFAYAGGPFGTVISMPITGYISNSKIGWPVAFYFYGAVGTIWSIFWFFFGYDTPSKHSSISEEEKKYIASGVQQEEHKENIPTPWKAILTSLPFWAILVAQCGQHWGFWTLLTEIPSYMQNILDFDIASNSSLSALPYLTLWLLSFGMSAIADWLIVKKMSIGTSRKIFNTIGLFVPAAALFSLSFVSGDQKALTVGVLVVAVGLNAGIYCGYNVNHIDLSPVHAGTLMGITNSLANVFALLPPLAVDAIKGATGYEETDKSLWTIVFNIAAGVYVAVGTFYLFAASGEVQPWNHIEETKGGAVEDEEANCKDLKMCKL